jgi:hypothetical protein
MHPLHDYIANQLAEQLSALPTAKLLTHDPSFP